jgi:hypothetical protein
MSMPCLLAVTLMSISNSQANVPRVSKPPTSFFNLVREEDREVAVKFYRKYIDVKGMPVVASGEVTDVALQRTYTIVTRMLAGRPDVMEAMVKRGMYLIIIGKDQVYTDMPEYRNTPDPAYMNERVRGTGGKPTSFGEENLLSLPLDRYDDESIGVHEFLHTVDSTLASMDRTWNTRKNAAYKSALEKGLWKNTYAAGNAAEFWAEAAQSYFDCNRVNNWNHGPIGTREQLKAYDPETYGLCRDTFRLTPETDWRYSWMQTLPNITAPPAKFKIDSYYTKFTWAREFNVVGRQASDAALLRANDIIRKMFAYRHDILKALINDGVKLVVLGPKERVADLPEFKSRKDSAVLTRTLDYDPATKTLVVDEANVMADPDKAWVGGSQVIRVMTRAAYQLVSNRPVDLNWEKRGRNVQQYELRVKRLDVQFGEKVKGLHAASIGKGRWKGTSVVNGPEHYWVAGVLAYFDAAGQDGPPNDADHPISTRELLRAYDPDLFALVHETMAYGGHVDWRLGK